MENGGRFADNQVDQLRRLGGSVQSGIVHIYIKKIIEQYSDDAGLISPGTYNLIEVAHENKRKIQTLITTYSVSIAQFYRIKTLYISLKQHYLTRI